LKASTHALQEQCEIDSIWRIQLITLNMFL